jgi:multicomponent Na+:H+ antiporter subunit G
MNALDLAAAALLVCGTIFSLLGGLGLLRLPDVYSRLSATSKAATLGVSCILLAGAIHFHDAGVSARALVTLVFVFLTAPVAAHMIGRAAYVTRVPLWSGTVVDELAADRTRVFPSQAAPAPRPAEEARDRADPRR